jgi:predicted Zn-ribbon and HTH transcriptional regulator
MTTLSRVECADCGWQGKRKPGNPVQCPRCGGFASYQE